MRVFIDHLPYIWPEQSKSQVRVKYMNSVNCTYHIRKSESTRIGSFFSSRRPVKSREVCVFPYKLQNKTMMTMRLRLSAESDFVTTT